MDIVVTGATGTVSQALVRRLGADPAHRVRALVRNAARWVGPPTVEVVEADLHEPRSLDAAMEGADVLWLLTAMGPDAPHASMNAVRAAEAVEIGHVVRMSAIGASHRAPTRNGRLHAMADEDLEQSDVHSTIVRPGFFMQNLFGALDGATLYGPLGAGRVGMIDVDDIAAFAARVLGDPGVHQGARYTITGPASISLEEVADDLGAVTGEAVRYQPVPVEAAEQMMLEAGMDPWVAAVNVEYARAYADQWGDYTTPDFEKVMQRPARSFREFARDNLPSLRA